MSYCRWSCDGFKSDLYIYEDVSFGYTIHVAGRKHLGPITALDPSSPESFIETHAQQRKDLDASELVPIGLPHDGETFREKDLEDLLARIIELKSIGYRVPEWVIPAIEQEIKEE